MSKWLFIRKCGSVWTQAQVNQMMPIPTLQNFIRSDISKNKSCRSSLQQDVVNLSLNC